MAENLGEAQLRLTVDLDAFQDSLRKAKALVRSELANVTAAPSVSGGRSSAARTRRERQLQVREAQEAQRQIDRAARQGGAREGVRALEIAQERRFRLARRIDALEERGTDVARLRASLGRLTETQSRRQFGSFRQISQQLARQVTLEERRLQTQRRQQRELQQQATVGARMGGARESIFALERAQDRRFRISQRIKKLEDRGVDTGQLRRKLGELTTSYAQRQFGTARQLSRELERQVSLTEARVRRERELQRAITRTARIGGAREPVGGRKDLPDSPAYLREQARIEQRALSRAAALGGPREPIRGRKDLPDSPAYTEEQRRQAQRSAREQAQQERARRLEAARTAREQARLEREAAARRKAEIREGLRIGRLNTSPVSGRTIDGIALPGSPNAKGKSLNLRTSWTAFLSELDQVKKDIDASRLEAARRRRGPTSPVSGRLINGRVIPGSPADIERQLKAKAPRGPSVPVSGRLINGQVVPGSPKFLEAQQREAARLAREQAAAERTRRLEAARAAREQARLDRAAAAARQAEIREGLRIGRLNTSPVSGRTADGIALPGSPNARGRDFNLRSSWTKFLAQLQEVKRDIDAASVETSKRLRGPASPISGRLINGRVIPDSPADIQRRLRQGVARGPALPISGRLANGDVVPGSPADVRRRQRQTTGQRGPAKSGIGDAIIGGAFPLLFGQGLGASFGGALGGLAGGALGGNFGFGLSLVGTALGSAVDALNQRFKDIAAALQTPVQAFDKLKEASLFASKAQEGYIQALIDAGRTAEATQAIQREAGKTIDQGAALLLAGSSEEVARAFSDLQDRLSNFTAGAGASFNQWLTELIRIAGGRTGAEVPLTGQQAVQAARGQQNTGGALLGLGAGLLLGAGALISAPVSVPLAVTAGVATGGLALGGLGAAGIAGGGQREAVATSAAVKAAEEQVNAVLERQKATQEQINAAKSAGLSKTAELLQVSNQFQAADQNAAQQRLQVEAQLAAKQITKQQAEERVKEIEDARLLTGQTLVATQEAAAVAAAKELANAQQLQGLKGAELQIAQELLKIDAARSEAQQAQASLSTASASGAGPEEIRALEAAATAAGDKLKSALVTGADAIKSAAQTAKDNFEAAARSLQSTFEGNFKFLDKRVQQQVLTQARQDISSGVERGFIDRRFLNARKPEDVLAAAQASRSQIQALEKFNTASSEYNRAIRTAKDAVDGVSGRLPDIVNQMSELQAKLEGLTTKDWTVNVSVTGDSAAAVRVD